MRPAEGRLLDRREVGGVAEHPLVALREAPQLAEARVDCPEQVRGGVLELARLGRRQLEPARAD